MSRPLPLAPDGHPGDGMDGEAGRSEDGTRSGEPKPLHGPFTPLGADGPVRPMTPLQAELLEKGRLPDPDPLGAELTRPDLAPEAGYLGEGPSPLEGPGGAGAGDADPAVFKMVPSYLAVGGGGAGAGWVGGLGALGGFVLPPVMGVVVARFGTGAGHAWAFGIFVLLALLALGLTGLLAWRWRALSRFPVRVVAVRCPVHGEKTEVWAQAFGGEMAPVRLLRCSLLPGEVGEVSCPRTCMHQVEAQIGAVG